MKGQISSISENFFFRGAGSLGDLSHSFEGSSSDLVGSWNWLGIEFLKLRLLGAGAFGLCWFCLCWGWLGFGSSALGFSLLSLSVGFFSFLTGARSHTRATLGRTIRAQRTQRTNTDKYGHIGRSNLRARGTYIVVTCTHLRTYDFP
jgi:hypothetical protein